MPDRAELVQFNEAVRLWAERFQPARVRRFAVVMGRSADLVTHTHYRSYASIAAAYRKYNRRDIGYMTVWRYLGLLEDTGIIDIERRKWGPADEHPGAQRNSLYTIRFDRVLINGVTTEHDFYGATGLETARFDTRDGTQSGTRDGTRSDTP